jgi:hypothetical protein
MKKVLAIVLAVTYLAISSGVVVSVHYCMGEKAGVAIGQTKADTCGTCGMDNEGCCHDDVSVVKIQDSHSMATAYIDFVKAGAIAQKFPTVFHTESLFTGATPVANAHGPPTANAVPRYIQHCVFRI